jgi:integrase
MTPTASRLRGRIEAVLGWAKAHHFRTGENPARWKENLDALLAPPNKVHKVEHLAAMPYTEIPAFVTELRESTSITARCLEFTILTACRVNETTGAEWPELALDNGASVLWTIPGSRTKSGREHKVPLVRRARDILAGMRQIQMSQWVFPGIARGEHLSGMAMLMHLRRARAGGLTVHGFRSSFKDWASEQTSFPDFLSEMALGHISGDKVRAAYARSELLDKRREMMTAWATWCYR